MLGSSLPSVVCRRAPILFTFLCFCLCIMVSSTYCVVFLFCFSRLVFTMFPISLDYPFVFVPSEFSDVSIRNNGQHSTNVNKINNELEIMTF